MSELPITRVALFKHGVGHFEREGTVEGDATLAIPFKQSEVSDVLKSLAVLDLDGGRVTAVGYDSTKPPEQLLAEVALTVPDSGSLVSLLPQLKGAAAAVTDGGKSVEGVLLGIDNIKRFDDGVTSRRPMLSLLSEGEVRTFDLFEVSIRLQDEGLRRDLNFYLRTQLASKKKDARTFTLRAEGNGKRRVRLSYVLEAPVWKATYRLLLNEPNAEKPLIQGWAVVDNTLDEDWKDVRLSLVAGLPVSFVHDLYTPRFLRRPEVPVAETAGVAPPEVEDGINMTALAGPADEDDAPRLGAYHEIARGGRPAQTGRLVAEAPPAASSTPVQTRHREAGDMFAYDIDHPVTIRRNQSALVPIVLEPFDGRAVLLYQKSARKENPMRAVEFRNTTGLTLEGGPVTVLDGGDYVGEAMIETMKPTEERLVAHAVELGVRVLDSTDTRRETAHRVIVRYGTMFLHAADIESVKYTFASKSAKAETLFLDHPRPEGWELTDTPEPHEVTANYWRFRLSLSAGETTAFTVARRRVRVQQHALGKADGRQFLAWIEQNYFDEATAAALRRVLAERAVLAKTEAELKSVTEEEGAIAGLQQRIRDNLKSLGDWSSERELRELYVKALNAQEDRLEALGDTAKRLRAQAEEQQKSVNHSLAGLEYEADLR